MATSLLAAFSLSACQIIPPREVANPHPARIPTRDIAGPRPMGGTGSYDQWRATGDNADAVAQLRSYLAAEGVADVVPITSLLRGDSARDCNAPMWVVPPRDQWRHIIPTLRLVRDAVIPLLGPVSVPSSYRSAARNACSGGARASAHLSFHALDLRPRQVIDRATLVRQLCALHARIGRERNMGLGIYDGDRFHIDTRSYRSWGQDFRAASSPCKRI